MLNSIFRVVREVGRDIEHTHPPSGTPMPPPAPQDGLLNHTDERLDSLALICAALWELLREKTGMTEEDLVERIAMIDARDGQADGKLTYTPLKCVKCNRTIFPKHRHCLYCGAPREVDSVFKTV